MRCVAQRGAAERSDAARGDLIFGHTRPLGKLVQKSAQIRQLRRGQLQRLVTEPSAVLGHAVELCVQLRSRIETGLPAALPLPLLNFGQYCPAQRQ
jgi:hypothetical protein